MNPLQEVEKLINNTKYDEAIKLINQINTDETTRNTVYGLIEYKKKNYQEAYKLLSKAIKLQKNNRLAHGYISTILVNQKRFKEAEEHVDKALEKYINENQFIINKALILNDLQKHDELVKFLQNKIEKDKKGILYTILVSAYRSLYEIDKAVDILEEGIKKFPENSDLKKVRADLLSEIDPIKSKSAFDIIFNKEEPGKATRWNSSFVDLRNRNWKRGFENYEFGLDAEIGQIGRPLPDVMKLFTQIRNLSEIDKEKWIILCGEQGIGDQVFFMSCIEDISKITKKIIILIDQRMIDIVQRSFPYASVMKFGAAPILKNNRNIQGFIPLGSLLGLTRFNTETFINSKKTYLKHNEEETEKYKNELKKHTNKIIVGISWKGGFWERQQKGKSIEISQWDQLLERKDMTFLCLQYGDTKKEQEYCRKKGYDVKFIKGLDFKLKLDSWLSLINACDLIISISTALVHFAGASGKKVYLLLGDKQQPFIWGIDETKSIVYNDINIIRMKKNANANNYFKMINTLFK
jgi:tetratricopeptide (TPR) repeat protein